MHFYSFEQSNIHFPPGITNVFSPRQVLGELFRRWPIRSCSTRWGKNFAAAAAYTTRLTSLFCREKRPDCERFHKSLQRWTIWPFIKDLIKDKLFQNRKPSTFNFPPGRKKKKKKKNPSKFIDPRSDCCLRLSRETNEQNGKPSASLGHGCRLYDYADSLHQKPPPQPITKCSQE